MLRTLEDFVRTARASGLSYSSAGIGSTNHLATAHLASDVHGTKLTHVPFSGGAPATNAVIGGQVDAAFIIAGNVLPHVRACKLVPIAMSSAKRLPQLPDVPTVAESGHAVFSAVGGVVLAVPAATPPETRAALAKLVREAMQGGADPESPAGQRIRDLELHPEAQAWLARETRLWSTLIQERRILE